MLPRVLLVCAAATLSAAALTGCVANGSAADAIHVAIADSTCAPAVDSAPAGTVTFELENSGTDVNEFYILAEDKKRIVGEQENLTPGQQVSFVAELEKGTYFTACKFQQSGPAVGLAEFTVTD
ncbi:MAG: hypothetical protein JWR33_1602 [Naasia sp.]|jgi:iron uptake system component EfeO|uniref:cupredoxin domain-containing protein n=1 Tax=Naasia sp. TaxID=2546198 RepID=UPI00261F76E6|nr:cupredoxin domain-containing protein [Naasia sp.]MCU1570861.1 hypothetical protein [Naasia sp.]